MQLDGLVALLPYVLSAVIALALGSYAFARRMVPGARSFGLYALSSVLWLLPLTLRLVVPGLTAKIVLDDISWVGTFLLPGFLVLFSTEFSKQANSRLSWRFLTILLPGLIFAGLLFASIHGGPLGLSYQLREAEPFDVLEYEIGPVFYPVLAWSYGLSLFALGRLVAMALASERETRFKAFLLFVGTALPVLTSTLVFTGLRIAGQRDLTPYAFVVGDLIVVYALTRLGVFHISQGSRAIVIEVMRDMFVVTDAAGLIRDYNPAARKLPGKGRVGLPLLEVIPSLAAIDPEAWKDPSAFVEIEEDDPEHRWLEVSRSPLDNRSKRRKGWHVWLFRDVTKRKLIEVELAATSERLMEQTANLQKAQAELVRSEKMAALVQLMAGIAHEINSPLGAITSSVDACMDLLPEVVTETAGIARDTAGSGISLRLLEHAAARKAEPVFLSTYEERLAEKKAAQLLLEMGLDAAEIEEASRFAARASIVDSLGLAAAFIGAGKGLPAIRATARVASLSSCLEVMNVSVGKIAKVVRSLRAVSLGSEGEKYEEIDLAQSIRRILGTFSSSFKKGIILQEGLQPGILMRGRAEELGQIWSNLIENAIQAIGCDGTLGVELALEGKNAHVRIIDDGPGIPESIRGKVFEPFFTTKRVGEGAGLGLDIARRAAANHGGSIVFDSGPGRTCFEVILPLPAQAC